jgi:hypothetical protein
LSKSKKCVKNFSTVGKNHKKVYCTEKKNWKKKIGIPRGVPFDVSPLPAVPRHDWDLFVLILFLLCLMTSQTSGAGIGAGQEAANWAAGQGTKTFSDAACHVSCHSLC